jgi:hypothetical protein
MENDDLLQHKFAANASRAVYYYDGMGLCGLPPMFSIL